MMINGYSGQGLTPFITGLGAFQRGTSRFQLGGQAGSATSAAFAQDIVRRTAPAPQGESSQPGGADPAQTVSMEGDGFSRISDAELADSLARAVDFVRGRHGDKAATAFMGLVYKSIGESEVTEENLGQALLQGVRFLDRNFGFAAGDAAMAQFNSDLNQAMNQYFNNGLNEQFYASTWTTGDQLSLTIKAAREMAAEQDDPEIISLLETLQAMLEESGLNDTGPNEPSLESGEIPASLAQDLDSMLQELQEKGLLPGQTTDDPIMNDRIMEARLMDQTQSPALPAKGLTLDITA